MENNEKGRPSTSIITVSSWLCFLLLLFALNSRPQPPHNHHKSKTSHTRKHSLWRRSFHATTGAENSSRDMEGLKRLTTSLAAPKTSSISNSVVQKSSRSFHRNELVGLGIVAAMSYTCTSTTTIGHHHHHPDTNTAPSSSSKINHQIRAAKVLSVSVTKPMIGGTKSIPIQSGAGTATGLACGFVGERIGAGGGFEDDMMEMEMSESYTCVVSQIGNDRVSKREYFDDHLLSGNSSMMRSTGVVSRGVFSRSLMDVAENEEMPIWDGVDFLSSCFLCGKDLRGIDIFMYRGEKAFCSVECRDVQIATDKLKEKCGRVRVRTMEHSESPCCSPMLSYTGVVAA